MKNNSIYWIKVKTPSILDEIFNSNLISQYKKLSLIDYGTANSSVYNYHFDDDRSFWVQANGISDVLSMLSTISVEFSTPILSFHDNNFAFFNSLGKKVELDDDVKIDFKKVCKVIEMQTGYFFDLEDEFIDHDDESDYEDNMSDDSNENIFGKGQEDSYGNFINNDLDYQFNFNENNEATDEFDSNLFESNEEEKECGCDNCECKSSCNDFENSNFSENNEKSNEEIIKELFEIASQENYDEDSNDDVDASNLSDTFMSALEEQLDNSKSDGEDKTEINDILKFFNESGSDKNDTKNDQKSNSDVIKELVLEEYNSKDCENEFDKLVNKTLCQEEENQEKECISESCDGCFGSCFCSQVTDNYDEIDKFVSETHNINKDSNENEEFFESPIDDFLIYDYEEPCCEDKLDYYDDQIEKEDNKTNSNGEIIMEHNNFDKDIEGFKEIGFEEIEKVLKGFFNTDNSLENVSDSTKDDVEKILKRIELLREQNNTNMVNYEKEIDLKPIYEALKKGEVTLDIYTEESQKYIIEKLNNLLDESCGNLLNNNSLTYEEGFNNETKIAHHSENYEIKDNGEDIQLEPIIATDLSFNIDDDQTIYNNLESFEIESTLEGNSKEQMKNLNDVLDSKFGGYNKDIVLNLQEKEHSFQDIDDVINSKFGGYDAPITSYEVVKNENFDAIDRVLDEKFGFYFENNDANKTLDDNLNSTFVNSEVVSNFDSVLDEKFGGYNILNNNLDNFTDENFQLEENNYEHYLNGNSPIFNFKNEIIFKNQSSNNNFEFDKDNDLFSENSIVEDTVDSFEDYIDNFEIKSEQNDFSNHKENVIEGINEFDLDSELEENLFNKFDESTGEETLVDLTVFDAPETITSDNIEKIDEAFESSETLFEENESPVNMFDLEKENLYKNIYDDVVTSDNNLNDALKIDEDINFVNNEISFETEKFEKEVLDKPKFETKKNNLNDLFKYDHSRIDLDRIKANSESQKAIINGLSEFLKKIEIEKNKLQQKRDEIEKKNQLAKQIITQGYDREKAMNFEKRNWR